MRPSWIQKERRFMFVDLSDKRILVVDDYANFRRMLKTLLQSLGASKIDAAADGEAAVRYLRSNSYDIILCDYHLGPDKKDGQQVLEEAKAYGLIGKSTIFIMITAENTVQMIMGVAECQPDDYLVKPFTEEVLMDRISNLVVMKAHFSSVDSAIQHEEFIKAISLCNEGIKKNPKYMFEFMRLKGDICIILGDYDDAAVVFRKVLSYRNISWAKLGLGKVFFYKGDYLKAIDLFKEIVKENEAYVEAYDWLSKTYDKLEKTEEAQNVLSEALKISPKSIMRQSSLGEIAQKNDDFDTAEKSFKTAVRLGKKSALNNPYNHANLAKVLMKKKAEGEALSVVKNMEREFKNNQSAVLQAAIIEGDIYTETGDKENAKRAVERATALYENSTGEVSSELAMELAKTCLAAGDEKTGTKLIQNIVKNHHEDKEILDGVQNMFNDLHLQTMGENIISSAQKEIVSINNKGVSLVKQGRFKEAIDYFEKAADGLPDNKIINANAAQACIMYMDKKGKNSRLLDLTGRYLEKIRKIDPSYEKYRNLLETYKKFVAS